MSGSTWSRNLIEKKEFKWSFELLLLMFLHVVWYEAVQWVKFHQNSEVYESKFVATSDQNAR